MNDYEEIALYNKDGIVCYTKIDEEDYDDVCVYRWNLSPKGYVYNSRQGFLHRFILNARKEDFVIDHINNDKLDNRRSNLRYATDSQNAQNKQKRDNRIKNLRICNKNLNNHNKTKTANLSSKFIGVSFDKQRNLYISKIRKDGKIYNLGRFKTDIEAAKVYNNKATELYGEYANLNTLDAC